MTGRLGGGGKRKWRRQRKTRELAGEQISVATQLDKQSGHQQREHLPSQYTPINALHVPLVIVGTEMYGSSEA